MEGFALAMKEPNALGQAGCAIRGAKRGKGVLVLVHVTGTCGTFDELPQMREGT